MPDRPIKLNWNLFRIVRKRVPEPLVEQETAIAAEPTPSASPSHRLPDPGEPLAYCADCHDWTPMRWRPAAERGKHVEAWFECEYCGGRKLTFRYVSMSEAMRRKTVTPIDQAVPPNGPASRGRRKGASAPAELPQPSEGFCDAQKRSEAGTGSATARRGGHATDLSQMASAATPTVPPTGRFPSRRAEGVYQISRLACG